VLRVQRELRLTATESFCLQCLEFWWYVVVKNRGSCGSIDPTTGAPGTRVSAVEAAEWVEERHGVVLHPKQVQRAFRALAEKGAVVRRKESTRWWCQAFTYYPVADEVRTFNPTLVGAEVEVVEAVATTCPIKEPEPHPSRGSERPVKSALSPSPSPEKTKAAPQPAARKTEIDKENQTQQPAARTAPAPRVDVGVAVPEQPQMATRDPRPETPAVTPALTPREPQVTSRAPQVSHQSRSARSTWDRIRALAAQFDPAAVKPVSPRALIRRDGTRLQVNDGVTAPLR
jgi:hypothetical protein